VLGAAAIAFVSARPYAGSWQDGSRFASVEALVDHHTLAIDNSIFVQVPTSAQGPAPYPADEPDLRKYGTCDKLHINGHFYTDKPVPALLMAGLYQVWEWCGGATARERPDHFCWMLTLASAGLAYVIAVWCVYRLGQVLRLPLALRLALTGSFALATIALPYTRHVNTHILLLAVGSAAFLGLTRLAEASAAGTTCWLWLAWLGSLAGLGYTLDLGTGPVLFVCLLVLVAYRSRRLGPVAVFILAALPWLIAHHALNYAVGGTLRPVNSIPEYATWPGCPFTPDNLTGSWKHGIGHFVVYAAALLGGKRGFLGHNLPLFLALPGIVVLFRRRPAEWAEVVCACAWCAGTWLLYAALSNNYSGTCCSVRWFVPLLAPAFYVLALFLRQCPTYRWDFCVLSGWGLILGGLMWWHGPWMKHLVPWFWPLQAAALLNWFGFRLAAVRRTARLCEPPLSDCLAAVRRTARLCEPPRNQ
jgi:hypothetical protein